MQQTLESALHCLNILLLKRYIIRESLNKECKRYVASNKFKFQLCMINKITIVK